MIHNKFNQDETFYFHHDINIQRKNSVLCPPHYHNRFEVYFITEGRCTYFIDNKSYHLQTGDMILIPPGVIHNTRYDDNIHSRMLINCSERYIPTSVLPHLPSLLYLYRNPAVLDEIKTLFSKIEREYASPDSLSLEILCCLTHSLFFTMVRNQNLYTATEARNTLIEQAIFHIQNNLSTPITLASTAKSLSVSPEHFSRIFKKETGFGFNKYLNAIRLQKAETLLKQLPKRSVSEIAAACGFDDSNYFSKKFKEKYRISPKSLQKTLTR